MGYFSSVLGAFAALVDAAVPVGHGNRTKVAAVVAVALPKLAELVCAVYPPACPIAAAVVPALAGAATALAPVFAAAGLLRKA